MQQAWRNQIRLVYRAPLVSPADRSQYLFAQPDQVRLERRQHGGGGEISRERLVAVQQVSRMLFNHNIDGIEQPLQIAFFYKWRPEVRHDEIAHEHHAMIRQVDEHGVVSLSSMDRDQFDVRSPDLQLSAGGNRDVRPEAAHVVEAEAFAEEVFAENSRCNEFA